MRIGAWKTSRVFDRYNIIDRRDMTNALRQLEEHEKMLAESRNGCNSCYSAPSEVQTVPPDRVR